MSNSSQDKVIIVSTKDRYTETLAGLSTMRFFGRTGIERQFRVEGFDQLFSRQRNELDLTTRWEDRCCVGMSWGKKECAISANLVVYGVFETT